jgi:hypothetical protein
VIVSAAFVPETPLLVPEIGQGAAPELDDLRDACRTAIQRATAHSKEIMVIGVGPMWAFHDPNAHGTLAGFGLPMDVPLGADQPGPVELPPSVTVGAWLLRDAIGPNSDAVGFSVGPEYEQERNLLGRLSFDLLELALIVVGDGSARRGVAAPGYHDERAADFDALVAAALASGDPARLSVDLAVARELLVGGAHTWDTAAHVMADLEYDAELLYDAAPYGVGYFAAAWTIRG